MGTKTTTEKLEKNLDELLDQLEALGTEIEIKLKLAGMDARDKWQKQLEPKLFEARVHARQAKNEAKKAIEDTVKAFEDFAAVL
jgi:hypothetical protein